MDARGLWMQNCCAGTMSVIVVFARSGRLNNRTINLERSDAVEEELTKFFVLMKAFHWDFTPSSFFLSICVMPVLLNVGCVFYSLFYSLFSEIMK